MPRLLAMVCLLAALVVAGCGGGSDSSSSSSASQSTASSTSTGSAADQQLRNEFIRAVKGKLAASGLPPGYVSCVVGKAEQISVARLKALGSATVFSPNSKAAKALGEGLGKQCIAAGAGVSAFRAVFIGSISKGLAQSGVSSAYRACIVKKSNSEISNAELSAIILKYLAAGPAAAQAAGRQIGKRLAGECTSAGVSP